MNLGELQIAIDKTREQIEELKRQIAEAGELKTKRRLLRQLKEIQYLQLWQLDQLEADHKDK